MMSLVTAFIDLIFEHVRFTLGSEIKVIEIQRDRMSSSLELRYQALRYFDHLLTIHRHWTHGNVHWPDRFINRTSLIRPVFSDPLKDLYIRSRDFDSCEFIGKYSTIQNISKSERKTKIVVSGWYHVLDSPWSNLRRSRMSNTATRSCFLNPYKSSKWCDECSPSQVWWAQQELLTLIVLWDSH